MAGFVRCVLYLALIGVFSFLLGRALPKSLFHWDRFPFRLYGWEKQGSVYKALGVQRWKEKVPDMSVILPKLMPSKRLPKGAGPEELTLMVRETCVAEFIHALLCVAGFGCVFLWKGVWGWVASVLYVLGNVPDIIIQRYNRPKLLRILQKVQARERTNEKCDHFELQHGTGA